MVNLLIILNVVMAGISIVFVVRHFLIKHYRSTKAFKNIALALCLMLPLFCALGNITTGFSINESRAKLEYEMTKSEDVLYNGTPMKEVIQKQIDDLDALISEIKTYTCAGFSAFILAFILNKNIMKEIKDFKPTGTWNFNKIK